ncbi:leader peptidase (prepilin peptidase)/N-methyltransferase [Paenibacillus sp. 1182]|uniref:prepilin peptidase n=1 Tax=Paenibacillus sp. 1182 TaxID=2806565 RepID=UPI001AE63459|nr:A24 family peptidase [Paenibacillus sp. 1182]MBP1308701.1 leader peptidase (prepilin peptidase)/N-methyltransferase [Paenibacillus sp. 1182]
MTIIFMTLLSILTQIGLNQYSSKKDFKIDRNSQIYAGLLNAIVWIVFVFKHPYSLNLLLVCLAFSILSSIFFIDLKYHIIPNEYNLALFILAVVFVLNNSQYWAVFVKGGLYFLLVFGLIFVLTKQLGLGDVKMSVSLGMFLGSGLLLNYLLVTFLTGACVSILLLLLKKKKLKGHIAFGPYMVLAFFYLLLN